MAAPVASHPGTYGFAMLAAAALVAIGASYNVGIFFFAGWLLLAFTTVMFVQDLGRRSWRLYRLHRSLRRADLFGDADFASRAELQSAQLLGAENADGIFLGAFEGDLLFYPPETHVLTIAPAGGGKTSGIVVPNVLHTAVLAQNTTDPAAQRGMLVTSKNGEVSAMCWQLVSEAMPESKLINPFHQHGLPNHCFNPLQSCIDLAAAGSPDVVDVASKKMKILIPEPAGGGGDNVFFRNGARLMGSAFVTYFALEEPERCTLPDLQKAVSSGDAQLTALLRNMVFSDAGEGYVSRAAQKIESLMVNADKTFQGQISELQQALAIFDPYATISRSIQRSEFDPAILKDGPAVLFIEIPEDRVEVLAPYVALLIDECVSALMRHPSKTPKVHFLLDEFQRLPVMPSITDALFRGRGSGLIMHPIIQDGQSLNKYKENASAFRTQSDVVQFFGGIRDVRDAEYLETRIGQRTLETANVSLPQGGDQKFQVSHGQQGGPRRRKDEILQTPPQTQYLIHRSDKVILGDIVKWWEVAPWRDLPAANPKEGGTPPGKPIFELRYGGRS